jgi:hypothetical protein
VAADVTFHDWNTVPLPVTRDEAREEMTQLQRELHGLANRLAACLTVLDRADG